jgi:hypothetical protein
LHKYSNFRVDTGKLFLFASPVFAPRRRDIGRRYNSGFPAEGYWLPMPNRLPRGGILDEKAYNPLHAKDLSDEFDIP